MTFQAFYGLTVIKRGGYKRGHCFIQYTKFEMIITQSKIDLFHQGMQHLFQLCGSIIFLCGYSQDKSPPGDRFFFSTQATDSLASNLLFFPERFLKKAEKCVVNFDFKIKKRVVKALAGIIKLVCNC